VRSGSGGPCPADEASPPLRAIPRSGLTSRCRLQISRLALETSYVLADIPRLILFRSAGYDLPYKVVRRATDGRVTDIGFSASRLARDCAA